MTRRLNQFVILALLLLYTFSQLFLIKDSLGCTVDAVFPLWAFLICLSTWYTTCDRRGLWIGIPASALLLYIAYRFYGADPLLQINDLFDRITGTYFEQLAYPGEAYAYMHAVSDHSLLFVLLSFLFSSYMSSAITSRSGRLILAFIGGLPFVFACLAVNRHPPIGAVAGLVLFYFLLAAGGGHYAEESNSYKAVLGALLPVALLLAALLLIVRPSQYRFDPSQTATTERLSKLIETADQWISERVERIVLPYSSGSVEQDPAEDLAAQQEIQRGSVWQDGAGGLDLTRSIDRENLNSVYLHIRAEEAATLYLRGMSYGEYTGSGWLPAEEPASLSSLAYTAYALDAASIRQHTLQISPTEGLSLRYLPYFCAERGESDSYFSSSGQSAYSASYFSFPASFDGIALPASYQNEEAAYRSFAHEYYTRLPETTRSELLALCQQAGILPGSASRVSDVARLVQRDAVYDLSTQPYPSSDYAVYFLRESHHGYCVHFATAATALFRALGIPARLTEGFLVQTERGNTLNVTGAQAHAWVEIYRDGLGWLPVEVTGRSGLTSDALGDTTAEPSSQPSPSFASEEPGTSQPQPEPSSGESSSASGAEPDAAGERPVGLVTQSLQDELGGASAQGAGNGRSWLWGVLAPLLVLLLVPLWYEIRKTLRLRSFEQADLSRAAVAIYRTACGAEAYGAKMPELIRSCAEKAVFSAHPVTADELQNCRSALFEMLKACYAQLSPWKRFTFRILHAYL